MTIAIQQFIKKMIHLLWSGRVWWLSFSIISFIITGLSVSFPIGLLASMLAHPTTSIGYQLAFQQLLIVNVGLLIAWVVLLDHIPTLKILYPVGGRRIRLAPKILVHFLWRDSCYVLFAFLWFSSQSAIGPHASRLLLFGFTGIALSFIEQAFMRCLSGPPLSSFTDTGRPALAGTGAIGFKYSSY